MRIAHIFTVHKNPAQLELLIQTMLHPDFDFYIHVDKKVDIGPFEYLAGIGPVYFITDRTECNWGGFSLVKAMMKSIDQVAASGSTYDFVNLMSAQDFPIKPIPAIHDFFNKNRGISFLSFDASNDTPWWQQAAKRYTKYHFTDIRVRGIYTLQKIINLIAPDRTFMNRFSRIYGGKKSTWWTITLDSAVYLSAYLKSNPALVSKLKYTWTSDEFIVATILMQSPFRDKIINENYRYINFTDATGHPDTLTLKDYDDMMQSPMLFARKFDLKTHPDILYKLQEAIRPH